MSDWVTVSERELGTLEPKRSNRGHSYTHVAKVSWPSFCKYCGLIPLKNAISKLCAKLGCDYALDPRVKQWRRTGAL